MKIRTIHWCAALLSCVGMMLPGAAWAEPVAVGMTDVALGPGGLLVGQVLNREGIAQAGADVAIIHGDQELVRTKTDENGVFAAKGLRGGQYQVATQHGASPVRAWAPNTAPPSAREGNLIIVGDQVVRGQMGNMPRTMVEWCKVHPWLCTLAVITAVAVPLAIAGGDDQS